MLVCQREIDTLNSGNLWHPELSERFKSKQQKCLDLSPEFHQMDPSERDWRIYFELNDLEEDSLLEMYVPTKFGTATKSRLEEARDEPLEARNWNEIPL